MGELIKEVEMRAREMEELGGKIVQLASMLFHVACRLQNASCFEMIRIFAASCELRIANFNGEQEINGSA